MINIKKQIDNFNSLIEGLCKKIIDFARPLLNSGQFMKLVHIFK